MRLSEAIRLGSMMKPQAFGAYFKGDSSCALGAAADAIGLAINDDDDSVYPIEWDWLLDIDAPPVKCPQCRRYQINVIAHLNDEHRWTRKRIADWVETIENRGSEEQTKNKVEVLTER